MREAATINLLELIEAGYEVVVIDTLSNSHAESLNRIKRITGPACASAR